MSVITIIGTGPGLLKYLTIEAKDALLEANRIFFRISSYPVCQWLKSQGKHVLCFDLLYADPLKEHPEVMYDFMTDAILKEVEMRGHACYALPGNPGVLEDTTKQLKHHAAQQGIAIKIIPGMSFLDVIYSELDIDPMGLQLVLPRRHLKRGLFSTETNLLVCQLDPDVTMKCLLAKYPADHPVTLIWTGPPDFGLESKRVRLKDLCDEFKNMPFASLYVPPR